jgi:hypothetical protein
MQTPQSSPSSSHPVLLLSLGARALGAALLAATAFACNDVPEEPEDWGGDVERRASAPDAGPTPSRTVSEADAPASADDTRASEGDAAASADAAPASADDVPAFEGENGGSRICVNACEFSSYGKCDDGRPGSETELCEPNMDCADCGSSLPSVPPS